MSIVNEGRSIFCPRKWNETFNVLLPGNEILTSQSKPVRKTILPKSLPKTFILPRSAGRPRAIFACAPMAIERPRRLITMFSFDPMNRDDARTNELEGASFMRRWPLDSDTPTNWRSIAASSTNTRPGPKTALTLPPNLTTPRKLNFNSPNTTIMSLVTVTSPLRSGTSNSFRWAFAEISIGLEESSKLICAAASKFILTTLLIPAFKRSDRPAFPKFFTRRTTSAERRTKSADAIINASSPLSITGYGQRALFFFSSSGDEAANFSKGHLKGPILNPTSTTRYLRGTICSSHIGSNVFMKFIQPMRNFLPSIGGTFSVSLLPPENAGSWIIVKSFSCDSFRTSKLLFAAFTSSIDNK